MKVVKASAEELYSVIEAVSAKLLAGFGPEAFAKNFPELASVRNVAVEEVSPYSGSGKFGFNGSL